VTKNGICLLTKNGRFRLDLEIGFERELLQMLILQFLGTKQS
jgi:hypothetical protein